MFEISKAIYSSYNSNYPIYYKIFKLEIFYTFLFYCKSFLQILFVPIVSTNVCMVCVKCFHDCLTDYQTLLPRKFHGIQYYSIHKESSTMHKSKQEFIIRKSRESIQLLILLNTLHEVVT